MQRTIVSLSCYLIVCCLEDPAIFISWLAMPLYLPPWHVFVFFVTHSNRYRNTARDYCNLVLAAILNLALAHTTWTSIRKQGNTVKCMESSYEGELEATKIATGHAKDNISLSIYLQSPYIF